MKKLTIQVKRLTTVLIAAFLFLPATRTRAQGIEQQVENYLSRMTLDEKIAVIHAQSKFSARGVPRLGLPDFWTDDGPHGVRPDVLWDEWEQAGQTNDSCVAFPALTCLAATWNPSLSHLYGKSLGEEALYRGKDMILGPCEHLPHAAQWPQLRIYGRGSVPDLDDGGALYPGHAGERRVGVCEAFCP